MGVLVGSGSGRLTDESDSEIPFQMKVTVEVTEALIVNIRTAEIAATDEASITPEVLRHAAAGLADFADYVAARVVRSHQATGKADFTWDPNAVVLGPRFIDELQVEVTRRRRSHRTEEDYERVARVYRGATQSGVSAQKAVAEAMFVTQSHAGALIAEARRRGLLPPARKGRKQSL